MSVPGFNGGPNYAAANPRLSAARGQTKRFRLGNFILPAALIFTISGIIFTMKWNSDRKNDGVCIDCARQKKMMDEVYANHDKPVVQKGYRL